MQDRASTADSDSYLLCVCQCFVVFLQRGLQSTQVISQIVKTGYRQQSGATAVSYMIEIARSCTHVGCRAVAVQHMVAGIHRNALSEVLDGLLMVAGSKCCIAFCLQNTISHIQMYQR